MLSIMLFQGGNMKRRHTQVQFTSDGLLDSSEFVGLIADLDRMESELGEWLVQKGRYFGGRMPGRDQDPQSPYGLPSYFWQALVLIWATSPRTRSRYPDDFRNGLIMAVESMDAESLMSLVRSWLRREVTSGEESVVA